MRSTFHPGDDVRTTAYTLPPTRRVIDAPTRMFHWLFAACFAGAYLTAEVDGLREVHVVLGYSMAGLLAFRVLYGIFGPRQVRLSALWRKASCAPDWLRSARRAMTGAGDSGHAPKVALNWRQGMNLLVSVVLLALLSIVVPIAVSGYVSLEELGGHLIVDAMEETHEALGEAFLWVVLAHIGLILATSLTRRRNLATPMLTGRVDGAGPDPARRNHAWLAVLLLASVLSYWAWEWGQPPAQGRSSLLTVSAISLPG